VFLFKTGSSASYQIALTNLKSDCDWKLYSYNSGFKYYEDFTSSYVVDSTSGAQYSDTTDETATVTLSADTYYYLWVDEWSNINSSYTLKVTAL
jgi:hypothetical protein